jgi:D-alanyl-D-alanine carboxypeptidase
MLARGMKGWLVALALVAVVAATVTGLWVTWDSTQAPSTNSAAASNERAFTSRTTQRPAQTTTTTRPPPPCDAEARPVATDPDTEWATTVVDTTFRLPEDFVPPDLVEVTEAGFDTRYEVRAEVIPDLREMRIAAEENGTPFVVISAYRSYDYQRTVFQRAVDEVGEDEAEDRIAPPGHSEHQLGTTVDVLQPDGGELTVGFADTPAGRWVADHAHEYGFVISYPEGGRAMTCYTHEPWHLRYVGREIAAEIHESGLTPREWMLAHADGDG